MIAMAKRAGGGMDGEDFDFVFGGFAMLSQYTANPNAKTQLARLPAADIPTPGP
jgi:hypothetical protein